MNIIKVLADHQTKPIPIGKQGENKAIAIKFVVQPWLDMWPGATIALAVQPPTGDAYPAVVTTADGITTWVITSADTAVPGTGKCELRVLLGDVVKKSITYITFVAESFTASGEAPDPVEDWIEDAQVKLGEVDDAVNLIENMTVSAAASETPTATLTEVDGHYNIAFGLVKGDKGDQGIQGPAGADGAPGQDGAPGADGRDGQDGAPGADGYSPTASVSKSNGVATITITDKNGTTTAQISDGATGQTGPAGADGYSPTATVTKSGDTATISITDKNGTTTAQITDGQPGQPGPGVPAGGTTGQLLSKKTTGVDYDTEWVNAPTIPVTDVQVNRTSILNNGVANVPIAGSDTLGLVSNGSQSGILVNSTTGALRIDYAGAYTIKNGAGTYNAITPGFQHTSVFYGLAKAAGDSTQSASSNAVGNYTESAKSAISQMLDAPETVSGSTPSITAKAGVRYICGECATLSFTPPASGDCEVIFESGSTATVLTLPNTVKMPDWFDATSLEANRTYDIIITNGVYGVVTSWA